jgi:hypothetical protein
MRYIIYVVIVFISLISQSVDAQMNDLGKTKIVLLKKSTYTISIPRKFNVTFTNGTDFSGYSISYRNRKLSKTLKIWIYYGYFPNSLVTSQHFLIDSAEINLLEQNSEFKIFKSNINYLIEGSVLASPDGVRINSSEKYLQFHFSCICDNRDSLMTIIAILKSLKLTELEIIVG